MNKALGSCIGEACEEEIPFDVFTDPFYSESYVCYLKNVERDVQKGTTHFAEHELIEEDDEQMAHAVQWAIV